MLLFVEQEILTDRLFEHVGAALDRGVDVIVGGATESITDRVESAIPDAKVFESELGWLVGSEADDEVAISRVMLVDRETLLVSSFSPGEEGGGEEHAIFAGGLSNGLVVLTRRLLASGLLPGQDPGR